MEGFGPESSSQRSRRVILAFSGSLTAFDVLLGLDLPFFQAWGAQMEPIPTVLVQGDRLQLVPSANTRIS